MQSQLVTARPAPGLAGLVTSYTGYRYSGARVGVHRGLPAAALTAIVSLEGPVRTIRPPEPSQHAVVLEALVGGLHTRAAQLYEPGSGLGIGMDLTPAGCRSLLGMPVSEVGGWVLPLDELLGVPGRELLDRLQEAGTWPARFVVLDDVLLRCRASLRPADATVERAWRRLTGGPVRVDAVAADVGYSPRHLAERFSREYGLRPKTVARLARFDRSRTMLQVASPRPCPTWQRRAATPTRRISRGSGASSPGRRPPAGARARTSYSYKTSRVGGRHADRMTNSPGTWPCLTYADARAAIRFLVDVLGFEERAVYAGDERDVAHAELRWPEGGGIMLVSPRQQGSDVPPGTGLVYIQTVDPDPVHARAVAANADIVRPLTEQPYGSREFAVRDLEGVTWSFGTYGGE